MHIIKVGYSLGPMRSAVVRNTRPPGIWPGRRSRRVIPGCTIEASADIVTVLIPLEVVVVVERKHGGAVIGYLL